MVALQLEAAGLRRLTTEDTKRGKPARYVDQSSALGSLLVDREDMQQACGIKVRPNSGKNLGVLRAKTLRTSRQSSLTFRSGRSNSRTSVRSTSRTSQKSARSEASVVSKASGRVPGVQGEAAAMYPKRTAPAKAKGRGRGSNRGRDNRNKGKTPGSKKRQRPQEQPKSQLTSGGNRHRPRRRSFSLSDTEIDMGAFSALQAKRVSWSTLARRPQLNRVHTVNAADIPSFVQKIAGKSLKGQAPEFFQLQRPDPEASSCVGFGHSLCLLRHCAQVGMLARFWAVCGVRSRRLLLKQAFIPMFVLTCRELAQTWQRLMLEEGPLVRNLSFLGQESDQLAPLQSMGGAHRHRQKPWDSSGWVTMDRRSSSDLVEQDDPSHSAKLKLRRKSSPELKRWGPSLNVRSSRKSLKKKQRGFFTFKQQKHNCTFLSHPRKDSPAANHQQAHWQLPQFLSRNSWCLFELLPSACGQELQACHWFVCSHHWLGWDSSGRGARHHVHFRH